MFNDKNRFGVAANIFIEIHIRYKPLYSEKNIENFIKSNYKISMKPDIYLFNMSKNHNCFYGTCMLNLTTRSFGSNGNPQWCQVSDYLNKIFATIFRD